MASATEKAVDGMARDLLCDFLTVAIHGILHSRDAYPPGVFKLRQKFNLPVNVCFHPDVFAYISALIDDIGKLLQTRNLNAVHVFITSSAKTLEQITFRLRWLDEVKTQDELNLLHDQLKACLLKLSIVDTYLPKRGAHDIEWHVEIDANEEQISSSTSWCKADSSTSLGQSVIPLKTVSMDSIKMELLAYKF